MLCKVGWGFVCAYTSAPVQRAAAVADRWACCTACAELLLPSCVILKSVHVSLQGLGGWVHCTRPQACAVSIFT